MRQRELTDFGAATVVACILLGGGQPAVGQVRIGVGVAIPGVSIGIDVPAYPQLVPVPGYPVYYAPGLGMNLFFYDGLYWVFSGDNWYYSSWYDGPWYLAQPELVPDFVLRIPIVYYRQPPPYFLRWNRQAPPHWGERWGRTWEEHRRGWDQWNRRAVPPRAPLPRYQSQYPGSRYPGAERQRTLENRLYPYRPRDPGDRSRLRQAPQFGQRIAPQPNPPPRTERGAPNARQPAGRPGAQPPPPARGGSGQTRREEAHPGQDRKGERRPGDRPPG